MILPPHAGARPSIRRATHPPALALLALLTTVAGTPPEARAQPAPDALAATYQRAVRAEGAGRWAEAAELYGEAAEAGLVPAMVRLGVLLESGTGVPRDGARAVELYRTASDAGDLDGTYYLARAYVEGTSVRRDLSRARRLFAEAGSEGDQDAQLRLALMIQQGAGGPGNDFAARRWLARAEAGPDRQIAREARELRTALDEDLLYSGLFTPGQKKLFYGLAFLAAIGLVVGDDQPAPSSFGPDPEQERARAARRADCISSAAARSRTLGEFVVLSALCR